MKRPNSKRNYLLMNMILVEVLFLTVVFYLKEVNFNTSYSLQRKSMEREFQVLKIENEQLVKRVTSLASISNIYHLSEGLDLIEVAEADYLKIPLDQFASR